VGFEDKIDLGLLLSPVKKRRDVTKAGSQWRPFYSGTGYTVNINFELQ
jgi:hypothetical protein